MKKLPLDFSSQTLKKEVIKAVKENNIAFVKTYIKEGGSVDFKIDDDIEHPTLLFHAKSAKMVYLLINNGISKSTKNSFICHSNTAIHHALATNAPDEVICAMAKAGVGSKIDMCGCKYDLRNDRKATPLLLALEMRNLSAVKAILREEPDLCVKDMNGNTPFHHVYAWERSLTKVYKREDGSSVTLVPPEVHNIRRKLEMMGADVSAINNFGQTPLEYASSKSGAPKPIMRICSKSASSLTANQNQRQ